MSTVIKNWDKKNWLSSINYIKSFNQFLIKNIRLNSNSKILDIGCGRGKILGTLKSKLQLKSKPIGIDITNHKDKDKRIKFKEVNAIDFLNFNKNKFDLILIKQTIHLISFEKIKGLLSLCKKNLNPNGKIFILTLDTIHNELPTFKIMKLKLTKSFKRDRKISKLIEKLYSYRTKKKFVYKVVINKKKYLEMVQDRYISTLLSLNKKEILKGIDEIKLNYKDIIKFNDKLDCFIL